jgi:hypothetical protein
MNKEFILYEQALALKELGFDEPCFAVYIDKTLIMEDDWLYSTNQDTFIESNNITAPLYQQAFRWFREKYVLDSIIQPTYSTKYQYRVFFVETKSKTQVYGDYMGKEFNTYEEAELECLKKLIKIVKQQ